MALLRNPDTSSGSSFLSRFQKKPPPTPPKLATPLARSFSVATRTSPLSDKPLPSPPIAQVVHQETGRTLLDASEVPMQLSRPLSPTRQTVNEPVWDIPQPPATTPDRTLQKRPSYHELKRKASEFIGLKLSAEDAAPPVPPIPAGYASISSPVVALEPSTPTPIPRSRLTAPKAVPRSRFERAPLTANPGSFKSMNSKTKGSGLGRPTGPPRSAGEAPPRAVLRNVSSSNGVVQQAPAVLPRTSSLLPPVPAPLSAANPRPAVLNVGSAQPTVATSSLAVPSSRSSGRGRIPVVPIQTPHSEAPNINADNPYAPALALANGLRSPSGGLPASPATVKSPTSSGPTAKDVTPVAANVTLPAPPRPFASPRHASRASQASQKSNAAKMIATPGSSRASSGSHEDTLPKTPSPLRATLTSESDDEPETLHRKLNTGDHLSILTSPEANVSQPAGPSCIEQSYAEFLRSIPVEQHAEVQVLMTVSQLTQTKGIH